MPGAHTKMFGLTPGTYISPHAARKAGLAGPGELIERDLQLGLEADIFGHTGLAPPLAILGPFFRQIQAVGHRQACIVIGDRQRHRHLAVILLADLAAVLSVHPDRMPTLLGKARIIDDPRLDGPVAPTPSRPTKVPG